MLEFLNSLIEIFKKYVVMLFSLPFYGNVTFGYLLLAIYISALVLGFIIGRMK